MRIPTAETEVGYVTVSHGAWYGWYSKETTYGINNHHYYKDKGRVMTWAEFKELFPYKGYRTNIRAKVKQKGEW